MTVEPIGGLGNRMCAIASALSLARDSPTPVRVVWTRTADCACPFAALFEPLPGATVVERGWWTNRLMRRVELYGGRHSREIRQAEMTRLLAEGYDFSALARERSVFIQTFSRFGETPGRPFLTFTPVASLQSAITAVTSTFGSRVVGVHVRRGDHTPATTRSPLHTFVERISDAIARERATQFFLATDSPEVEADLRRRFGDRILWRPKTFGRDSVAGIRDALVELYCLSRTCRIIGSFYSSFCETAAEIGGVSLDVVDTENRPLRASQPYPVTLPIERQ